ncbi:hypothetical protein MRX96_017449 [Rhipicephalus microplus]
MDFSNSRKRLREKKELSRSEFRTTVKSEVASTTADMTSSATTGSTDPASSDAAGTCQLPTTASTDDLSAPGDPCSPSPHTEGLPLPATSLQGVENTLLAPAAERTTESPDNPPPDASAAMERGATPTNRRKKGKKKPTKKQPSVTASEGTAANLPHHFGKAPHCSGTTRRHSSAAGSPPDTEGFQVVTTRGVRCRARNLAAAAALPVDPAIVGTVLFRPSAPGGTFSGSPRLILAQALSARPGVAAVHVNQKRNIVAADATTRECLVQLLTIKELKGIPVTAKEPSDHRISTGFLHGVDEEPAVDSLLPGIQSAIPVLSAAREGRTVTLRFAGPVLPEHVPLFLVRFPVRPARPRPLQCRQCDTPECPPVAGAAEGCHYHGIFLTILSRHAVAAVQDPSRRLANLVASHSRGSSLLALLPLLPRWRPLLFQRPRLLQLPLSQPSLLLLSPEASLLCPRLLWPRLL